MYVNIKLDIMIFVFVKMIFIIKLLCEVKISFIYVKLIVRCFINICMYLFVCYGLKKRILLYY